MANAAATAALQVLKPDAPKSNSSKKQQALLVLQSSVSQLSKPERVSLRDDIEASLISVASEPALTPPLRAAYLGCLAACASADDRIVFRVADGLLALLQQSPAQLAPIAAFAQLMSCVSHSLTGKCTDVFAAMLRTVKDSASSPRCRAAAFSCARSLIVRFSPALSKSIPDIIKVASKTLSDKSACIDVKIAAVDCLAAVPDSFKAASALPIALKAVEVAPQFKSGLWALSEAVGRWFAAAGDTKLLQALLVQGHGWARGYASAALVECIKIISEGTVTGGSGASGGGGGFKDVAAILSATFDVLIDEKVSRSIGDERDCCACINFIMHSTAPLLLPPVLEAHISYLRIMVSKGRDVQAVVAWQQLAVLTQLGRIPRSSCDWFIDAIAAAAAGPSSPALRMALATALRACVIKHQLSPLPLLSRFLSFTLVPEPAVSETMETFTQLVRDVSITGLNGVQLPALAVMKSACFCIAAVLSAPAPHVSIPSRIIRHIMLCAAICFSHMDRDYAFPHPSPSLFSYFSNRASTIMLRLQGWTLVSALSFPRVPEVAQLWDVLLDWWAISLAGGIALPASHKDLVVEYSNRAAALESLHQFVSTLHSTSSVGGSPDISRPNEFHTTFEVVSDLVMKNLRSELLQKRPPELCETVLTPGQETSLFCASDNMRCWLTRMMRFIPLDSLSSEFHSILDKQFKVLTSSRGIGTQLASSCAPAHPSDVLTMFLPGGHPPAFQRMYAILEFPTVSLSMLDGCDATRLWNCCDSRGKGSDFIGPAMQPSLPMALDLVDATVTSLGTLFVVASPRDQQVLLDIFLKKIVAGLGGAGNSPDARRAASISNISTALCISLQQMILMRGMLAVPVWLSSAQSACMAALIYGARPTQLTAAHGLGLLVQINSSEAFLKDTLSKLLRDAAALAQSYGWVLPAESHVPARLGCVLGLAAVAAAAGTRAAIYLPDILEYLKHNMEELPADLVGQGFPGVAASLRSTAAVALARVMSSCNPGSQYAKLALASAEAMNNVDELLFEEGLGDESVILPCVRIFLTTAVIPLLPSPSGPVLDRVMPLILPLIRQFPVYPHGRALRLCFLDFLLSVFSKGLEYSETCSSGSIGLQLALDWACCEGGEMDVAVQVQCLKVISFQVERLNSNTILSGMKYLGGSRLGGGLGDILRVIITLHHVADAANLAETAVRAILSSATSNAAAEAAAGQSKLTSSAIDEVALVLVLAIQGRVTFSMGSSSDASSSKEQSKESNSVKKDVDADGDDGDGGEGAATLLAASDEVADHVVSLPTTTRAFAAHVFSAMLRLWWGGDSQSSHLRSTTSFVSAAYSAATSDDPSLRVEGLDLLASLIIIFGPRADPDATGCFILEQCAAQIMSAMRSCLSSDSPARVRAAAALALGFWMECPSCNRTPGAVSRCMKILQSALGSCSDASSCSSSTDDEASCRLALVAALARGIQADSATSVSGSSSAAGSASSERGTEYQELANVFDAQLLQLLKVTHSGGDSKNAIMLAPSLLSAACAHAIASQSRIRAGSALSMWIAAATAAPCAGLLLGGGLHRLFSAFSAKVALDEEENSDDGFDEHLIRAAIVCAAVIVESTEASDSLPLCEAFCECSRAIILNSPRSIDPATALIMLRNLVRLMQPLKSQPEANADLPLMKNACFALEVIPQLLALSAAVSPETANERQAAVFLIFSALYLGREEPVHVAAARSLAALASNSDVWNAATGGSSGMFELLGATAWSLANILSTAQLPESNRNSCSSVLLVLLCRWCSSGMHRDVAAFSRAFLSFCSFVAGAACSLPLPPTLAACSKLLTASSGIVPIAPETRSLVAAMCTLCSFSVHAPSATAATADASMDTFKSIVSTLLALGQNAAAEALFASVVLPCILTSFRLGATSAGVDALAHCVAAVGAAARAAVAAISPEDRACMQEAVKCSQTAAAEEASAPVVAAHRTSAQVAAEIAAKRAANKPSAQLKLFGTK